MLPRLAALVAAFLFCLSPSASAWNSHASINEVASWLAMRPVSAKCLNKWESEKDFVISSGAAAYVEGMYDVTGRWRPSREMVVAFPICNWFVAMARGDASGYSAPQVAFAVLVVTHESGHLRDWRRATLVSSDEASTQRWALRHVYAVSRRIGLSHDAAVLVLRYAVLFHRDLPPAYHANNCRRPWVDAAGLLRDCGVR